MNEILKFLSIKNVSIFVLVTCLIIFIARGLFFGANISLVAVAIAATTTLALDRANAKAIVVEYRYVVIKIPEKQKEEFSDLDIEKKGKRETKFEEDDLKSSSVKMDNWKVTKGEVLLKNINEKSFKEDTET